MRIQAKDISMHLKRGLSSLYCVFGDEPLQHQEALDAIRLEAKNQGYTEREVFEVTAQFEWESLFQSLQSINLFSDKRLIECRLQEGKIGKVGGDALIKLANNPSDHIVLLFTIGKVDTKTQSSGWFTAIERKGQMVWARPLPPEEYLGWLNKRCLAAGLAPTVDAIQLLFERTEGNCLAAAQTIEKLSLLAPAANPRPLSVNDVMAMIEGDARFSLFDLVDAALNGDLVRTTRIFKSLKNEGTDPILILWAIAREVRSIIPLAREIKAGRPEKEVFSQHGVWKRREAILRQFIPRFSISALHNILTKAKDIDDNLKGRSSEDGWTGLFLLCLSLTGAKNAGGYHE